MKLEYEGITLNLDFRLGHGHVQDLPKGAGIYAQIHWPTKNLRIGESGNVRARNMGHINWARKHQAGSHNRKETDRRGDIVSHAKQYGFDGSECYVISDDPRLEDREFRVECEKFLHLWAKTQTEYVDLNRQVGYRTTN